MLTTEGLREGQMWVETPDKALGKLAKHVRARVERTIVVHNFDVVLGGLCASGDIAFPYPGPRGATAPMVVLRRDQAEHLALELLKVLNGGAMPDDSAELVDFISTLGR